MTEEEVAQAARDSVDFARGLRAGLDIALRIARDTVPWPAEYARDAIEAARDRLCGRKVRR